MGDERMFFRDDDELGLKRNDQDKENKEKHIARYAFAATFVKPKDTVLRGRLWHSTGPSCFPPWWRQFGIGTVD